MILETNRLILRLWQEDDFEPLAALSADPRVMAHYPKTLTRSEVGVFFDRIRAHQGSYGYGLYAVERKDQPGCIGYIGLLTTDFSADFTPATEIGWRLAFDHWGQGFATEGAKAVLAYGFSELHLPEIVSFTAMGNVASCRVMEKIGLVRNVSDDFDHPNLPEGHSLRRHVLYRLSDQSWRAHAFISI